MKKTKIVFVGTGLIGAGLAANAALNGLDVVLYHVSSVERMQKSFRNVLNRLTAAGVITEERAVQCMEETAFCTDLQEALRDADFVQESIPERADLKKDLYRKIQEITGERVIIASATSAMLPEALREDALYPQSILVGHPYNPAYLLPLIEVCAGENADEQILERTCSIYRAMGKEPIVCKKSVKGFLVNGLSWQVLDYAKRCVRDGLCSAEDIDKAVMYGPGLRMAVTGQLLGISLGIDGGFRKAAEKYGLEANELDLLIADSVDEEMSCRSAEEGKTPEEICVYRDRMLAGVLRLQKKL